MNTRQLERILRRHLRRIYTGVYAEDELPIVNQRPLAIIINTEPSESSGQHWTALYIRRGGFAEFLDTRGVPPDAPVLRYLRRMALRGFVYNRRAIQSPVTTVCGMYCADFLISRYTFPTMRFEPLLRTLFPFRDPWLNDLHVYRRFRSLYGIDRVPLIDVRFL